VNCYRLAKFYSCDPQIFLNKTFSQISRDLHWTDMMQRDENVEAAWQEKLAKG
jgi:hypothetical protein